MRIVCCYTPGNLRSETLDALETHAADRVEVEFHSIDPRSDLAYANIIGDYWARGQDFMVVEPDIVVRPDVIDAFLRCDCWYGCFPYAWTTNVGPALGCTWFRKSFLRSYPTAARDAQFSWRQFDCVLMRHKLARDLKEQPHVHLPPVQHLNPDKQLLEEADPTPLMEVPLW